MIDKTHGHLANGHVDRVRERMNARTSIAEADMSSAKESGEIPRAPHPERPQETDRGAATRRPSDVRVVGWV